jgi:hypothetical protein
MGSKEVLKMIGFRQWTLSRDDLSIGIAEDSSLDCVQVIRSQRPLQEPRQLRLWAACLEIMVQDKEVLICASEARKIYSR